MTRIIAGFAGSLALAVPRSGTRPTSDRVREAIFSALESRDAIRGARVADLYAGSGALGLEAISRGAASVVLVERAPSAAHVCRENAAKVLHNLPTDAAPDAAKSARPTVSVTAQSVHTFLQTSTAEWDLVFIDPPYDLNDSELTKALVALSPRLAADAIVILERATKSLEPTWPAGISLERSKNYGDTTLWWASAT